MSRSVDLFMPTLFRTRKDVGFLCSKHLKYCEVTGHKAQHVLQFSGNHSGWKRHPRSSPAVNPAPPWLLQESSRLSVPNLLHHHHHYVGAMEEPKPDLNKIFSQSLRIDLTCFSSKL